MSSKDKTVQQALHSVACCLGENIDQINTTLQEINQTLQDDDNDVTQVVISGNLLIVTYEDGTSQSFSIPCTCATSPDLVANVEFTDESGNGVYDNMNVTFGDGAIVPYPLVYVYEVVESASHDTITFNFSNSTTTTVDISRVTDVTVSGNNLLVTYEDGNVTTIAIPYCDGYNAVAFNSITGQLDLTKCSGSINSVTISPGSTSTSGISNEYLTNNSYTYDSGTNSWTELQADITGYDTIIGKLTSVGNTTEYYTRRHFDLYNLFWFDEIKAGEVFTELSITSTYQTITSGNTLNYKTQLVLPNIISDITPLQLNIYGFTYAGPDDDGNITILDVFQIKNFESRDEGSANTSSIQLYNIGISGSNYYITIPITNVSSSTMAIASVELVYSESRDTIDNGAA